MRADGTAVFGNESHSNSTLETLYIDGYDFNPNSIVALGRHLQQYAGLKLICLVSRHLIESDVAIDWKVIHSSRVC